MAAAYRVLNNYFHASEANLSASYAASLADLPPGTGLEQGKRGASTRSPP